MIYVFLANGFEEIEGLAPVDILRRARIEAKTVGVTSKEVTGCSGIKISCDMDISEISTENLEGIVLPGGMPGSENLFKSEKVKFFIEHCFKNQKLISAICAAPMILGKMGILKGKNACCYPGFEKDLKDAVVSNKSVCVDGNIITAKGPGIAIEFALALVKYLLGEETSQKIRSSMQCI